MEHTHSHSHPGPTPPGANILLDIGGDVGALLLYTDAELAGREIEVSPVGSPAQRTHVEVLERWVNGGSLYAAAYPELTAGKYDVWDADNAPRSQVTISGGCVASLDWRSR